MQGWGDTAGPGVPHLHSTRVGAQWRESWQPLKARPWLLVGSEGPVPGWIAVQPLVTHGASLGPFSARPSVCVLPFISASDVL